MSVVRLRRATIAATLALLTTGAAWTATSWGVDPAGAATTNRYVATTGTNTGTCTSSGSPCKTIQYAVDNASAGDTIHIAAGTYAESVLVSSTLENDPDNLTFVGAGIGQTTITGDPEGSAAESAPIDANFGIFFQGLSGTVRDLTTGGVKGDNDDDGVGVLVAPAVEVIQARHRAAESDAQTVTLDGMSASGNSDYGVDALGEGSDVAIVAQSSHFDDNGTSGGDDCGLYSEDTSLSFVGSTASGNSGCGVLHAGEFLLARRQARTRRAAATPSADAVISQSAVDDNTLGGVIMVFEPSAAIYDTTMSGNDGGGIGAELTTLAVTHDTITDTGLITDDATADQGGITVFTPTNSDARQIPGLRKSTMRRLASRRPAVSTSTTVNVSGTIVSGGAAANCSGTPTDAGYNISSDSANSCGFSTAEHSQTKTNPKLGTLGAHGGLTDTQLPLKLSPAIDAEPSGQLGCASDDVDQRGVARPQPTGGRCDIGSVELAATQLAIHPDSLPHGTVGTAYKQTLTATGGQYPTYSWSLTGGSLPPGIAFADGVFSGTPTKAGTYTVTVSVNDPVSKTYTIVIDAAATTPDHGNGTGGKLADTGVPTLALGALALVLLALGLAALYAAGLVGLPGGRHRTL